MLFRLEKLQRVFSDGQVDEMVGAAELGQLLDGLGITAEQLGVGQVQPLLPLLPLPQQAQQAQQAQQVQQQMVGAGGMQVAGLPHTGDGLLPELGGGLHMLQPPFGVPAGPGLHPAALVAAQQAALLASASQYATVASAPGMLPLGSMPFAAGFPLHVLAPGAAGGVPAPAHQPAAAAGVPWAATAGTPAVAVPAVEPATAAPPVGTTGRAGGSSGGGSDSSSHSSSDIANLQEAQSATEDAQQLLSEDVERLSIKVEGHDGQLRWAAQPGFAWEQVAGLCMPPASTCRQVLCVAGRSTAWQLRGSYWQAITSNKRLRLLSCVQWAAHTFQRVAQRCGQHAGPAGRHCGVICCGRREGGGSELAAGQAPPLPRSSSRRSSSGRPLSRH